MDGADARRLSKKNLLETITMKKLLLGTVALVALGATVPALAADLGARPYYNKAPAYVAPIYNWTGFYVGGHVGGAFSSDNNFNGLATGNNSNGRFLGGLQGGADYQFAPNWVLGVEGQYSWLSGNVGAVFPGGFAYNNNQRGLGSVTGRVGYTWGPGLLYVKGGYAYSDNNESVTLGGVPVALVVLAIAQMGVHLVFFLHITTGADNTNNILALAFGMLIVFLVIGGSLWIMANLNQNMMPMDQLMQMQR